ncbi:MAG: cob(I)yrinic acid a,c-diamide adenosyltransferase, partial [Calditrichaeota bacterium]
MGYRITKVYTRQGDTGETRLGGGQKVRKDSTRIEAYGTVDELNSTLGIALAFDPHPKIKDSLNIIQHHLFRMGGDLCLLEEDKQKLQVPVIEEKHVSFLEELIDSLNNELEPLEEFILPRGTTAASFLHQARCVCRRAERIAVRLAQEE